MKLIFDVDGTLVDSFLIDEECYVKAVQDVVGVEVDNNWEAYRNVTDSGLLLEILESHGLSHEFSGIEQQVRSRFVTYLEKRLRKRGLSSINGAVEFWHRCLKNPQLDLAIATGGWRVSAELKLKHAGIRVGDVKLASSDDSHSRIEIMRVAIGEECPLEQVIYLGDGAWDKAACEELGVRFIAVGDRVDHSESVADFADEKLDYYLRSYL